MDRKSDQEQSWHVPWLSTDSGHYALQYRVKDAAGEWSDWKLVERDDD